MSSPHKPLRLGVLASGNGTNFQAILDAIAQDKLSARVSLLIVNCPEAGAIRRAQAHQIPFVIVDHQDFPDRDGFSLAIARWLEKFEVDLVVLAGFMRLLGKPLIEKFPRRIINIHPSLLPALPGLKAIEKAFASGATETGVSIHFIDEGLDTGQVIAQRIVPINPGDTLATLEARIHATEHELYPEVLEGFAQGKIQ